MVLIAKAWSTHWITFELLEEVQNIWVVSERTFSWPGPMLSQEHHDWLIVLKVTEVEACS